MLKNLIQSYWRVSIFSETPENTPYSPSLMVIIAFCFSLLLMFQWQVAELQPVFSATTSVYAAVSMAISYVVYTYILLKIYNFSSRLTQTLTCLWATHTIVHLFAFPFLMMGPTLASADMKNPILLIVGILYLFVTLGLSIWQFLVTAHIYRFALSISTLQSLLASIGLLAVNILTVSLWR